jgi:hypothetical protein
LRELGCKAALEETDIGEIWRGDNPDQTVRKAFLDTFCRDIPRDDPLLLQVIDELGIEKVTAHLARLKVVKIPDGVDWEIDDYDGMETVEEKHREWS